MFTVHKFDVYSTQIRCLQYTNLMFTVHKFNIYSTQIWCYKMESKYQGGVITKVYMINLSQDCTKLYKPDLTLNTLWDN